MYRTYFSANRRLWWFGLSIGFVLALDGWALAQNAELDRKALDRHLETDYLVLDWRDRTTVPEEYAYRFILTEEGRGQVATLPIGYGKKDIFVLAGDLKIETLDWDTQHRSVYLCADTLQIAGKAAFQTGHPDRPDKPSAAEPTREARSAGNVTILARHVIFGKDGQLKANMRGATGSYFNSESTEVDDLPCGNGGNLTVIAERLDLPWRKNVDIAELGRLEGAIAKTVADIGWQRNVADRDWRRAELWSGLLGGREHYDKTPGVLNVHARGGESISARKLKRDAVASYDDAELALRDLNMHVKAGLGAVLVDDKSYNLKDPKQVEKARAVLNKRIEKQKATDERFKRLYDTEHRGRSGLISFLCPDEHTLRPLPLPVLNRWALLRGDALKQRIEVAEGHRNAPATLARLFYEFRYLPAFPVKGDGSLAFQGRIESLNRKRKELVPPVWHETVTVSQEGLLPRDLHLFTDGNTLQPMLAPTFSLLRPIQFDGKPVFGVITFDLANVERATFHFDVMLAVDPRLAALAEQELLGRGITYPGAKSPPLFTECGFVPSDHKPPGVEKLEVTVLGPVLHCSLTLSPAKGAALQQLASTNGLLLRFNWFCTKDPSVKGEDLSIPVSFARQTGLDVSLERGKVLNRTGRPVTMDYYRFREAYHPFVGGPQTIPVGALTTLNVPANTDPADIQLPVEACALKLNLESLAHEFVGAPTETVEYVTVTNELPTRADQRGGNLDTVALTVTYCRGEGRDEVKQTAGPYPLARKGALGSSVAIPFVKRGDGSRNIMVTGVANYGGEQDGQRSVRSKPVEDLTIRITEEMLLPISK